MQSRHPIGARPRAAAAGFSLLEALVVIFVLGIAMAIGVPSLLSQLSKTRLESSASDVANLMRQTRLRAIRDNTDYTVSVSGTQVVGMGAFGTNQVQLEFENPVSVYPGPVDCQNKFDGSGTFYGGTAVTFQGTGSAVDTGAICIHDGKGNILQIVLEYRTGQPKIRKYLNAGASPTGSEGFFEKTGFNVETQTANAWVWY